MGLRPGPHVCLLPPWWLTLGRCTAIGGRTRLGRWLAGPCPPCVANRPSVAHWQNHWGQATEPTMVRACPPSFKLVCMLHATIFEVPTAGCGPNVSCLEVSGKPPANHFQAQLHHNGARWPKSEGTFLWAVFAPGLIGAARNGPSSSLGVRLAAARAVSWKFPGNPPQHACGPGCATVAQWGKIAQI